MKKLSFIFIMSLLMLPCSAERGDFEKAVTRNTIEAYQEFLEKYPESKYNERAKEEIVKLEFSAAIRENTVSAYQEFAQNYPGSPRAKLALQRAGALTWPPPPGATAEAPSKGRDQGKLSLGSGGYGTGWGYLYDEQGMRAGWGAFAVSGVFEIGISLFEISESPMSYAENFFEVVYYDDARTIIRLDPEKGHKLLFANGRPMVDSGNSRIQYAGREYRLTREGWYVISDAFGSNEVLVYAFTKGNSASSDIR